MKNFLLFTTTALCLTVTFIFLRQFQQPSNRTAYTIGILQTASHPALDAVREGFVKELKHKLGKDIRFIVRNAQGSIAQAHTIAQQFHADAGITAFLAIATPATQALSSVEKKRPIVIAAVTDPEALGLLHEDTNICGTRDMIDVKGAINMMVHLVPSARTVGILYTNGETNSEMLAAAMRAELESRGLQAFSCTMSHETDLQVVTDMACRKYDLILAPTDNTIASGIAFVAEIARAHKKPLVVSDNLLVSHGALAARGVNYQTSGAQAAQIACEVMLNNRKPSDLPICQGDSNLTVINETTLNHLGLQIPSTLDKVILVKDQQ